MKRKRLTLLFFLLLTLTINAYSQTDLKGLINYAMNHNRQIKKSDLQIKESEFAIREITGNGLPHISDSANYIRSGTPSGMPEKIFSAGGTLMATQLIYSQSFWVGLNSAKKVRELYSSLKVKNKDSVIVDIATGYYQAGSLILQLQTIDKSIKNLKELLRIAELQYKSDFIKETNVSRLKVTITNLEVTKQTIENGITTQLNFLKAIAGMPLDTTIIIDTASMVSNDNPDAVNITFKVDSVPVYQTLLKQSELNKQQVKLSISQYFPTVAGFGMLKRSANGTEPDFDKWTNANAIGIVASMPLFTSGTNYSKVKQAQLRVQQLEEDISQLKDFLKVQFDNAVLEYHTANELLSVQKDNRDLAQKVYNQTSSLYQEGMASLADLLNVNSDFLQADNSYNQQILKCKISEIKMLNASGNLNQLFRNN